MSCVVGERGPGRAVAVHHSAAPQEAGPGREGVGLRVPLPASLLQQQLPRRLPSPQTPASQEGRRHRQRKWRASACAPVRQTEQRRASRDGVAATSGSAETGTPRLQLRRDAALIRSLPRHVTCEIIDSSGSFQACRRCCVNKVIDDVSCTLYLAAVSCVFIFFHAFATVACSGPVECTCP